jgi:hypothetical protein
MAVRTGRTKSSADMSTSGLPCRAPILIRLNESTPEAEAEYYRLNDAFEEAACTLADTQPNTTAGADALLRHAVE